MKFVTDNDEWRKEMKAKFKKSSDDIKEKGQKVIKEMLYKELGYILEDILDAQKLLDEKFVASKKELTNNITGDIKGRNMSKLLERLN